MSFEQWFDLFKVIISALLSSTIASIIAPILLSRLGKKTGKDEEKIALTPKEKERRDEERKREKKKIKTTTFTAVFFVFILLSAIVYSSDHLKNPQKVNSEKNPTASTTPANNNVATTGLDKCTKNLSIYKGAYVFVNSNSNNNINVRKIPGVQSPIVTTLPNGTSLLVLSDAICIDNTEWWEITNNNGNIKGWVAGHLIKLDENK